MRNATDKSIESFRGHWGRLEVQNSSQNFLRTLQHSAQRNKVEDYIQKYKYSFAEPISMIIRWKNSTWYEPILWKFSYKTLTILSYTKNQKRKPNILLIWPIFSNWEIIHVYTHSRTHLYITLIRNI